MYEVPERQNKKEYETSGRGIFFLIHEGGDKTLRVFIQ